ncbi:MAG: hypothetical protein GEU86_14830 [Actinophytocola sp.]|nr:hypothetical protein [Actinophytocola sp.]
MDVVCSAAGKAADELTRRDVARALLTVPAREALEQFAGIRRELTAAGNPLSATFWNSTEATLSSIEAGSATVGDVRLWLEATGTEPTQLFPAEGFLWSDEDERGPVAAELHARLVSHLEALVAAGVIDSDLLVRSDDAALAAYRQAQLDWLRAPLPDGRVPFDAIAEEEDDEFLAKWDEAEADARSILGELLSDAGPRPCPQDELAAACDRLRDQLGSDEWPYQLLRTAAGVDPATLPRDDRELWLTLAAGVVTPNDEPPDDPLNDSSMYWYMLGHEAWIAAAVSLARNGPSTVVDADSLAHDAATFDFENTEDDEFDDAPWLDDLDEPEARSDQTQQLSLGFFTVALLWRTLGALDVDDRLTELGWWGIPESLLRAWQPHTDPS